MAVVSINELKSYFDKVGKKPTTSQYENLIDTLITTTVGGLVSVTYAQMQAAILAGSINAGRIYKITDRGDLGLYFIGLSNTTLDFKNGARDMLVPLTYDTGNFGGFDWLGIWNAGLTPLIGNLVIWGGHVWRNLSGNLGAPVDDFSLDAEWELMTKSIGMYKVQTLGCNYDFENDWISRAWDNRGNVAGCSYEFAQAFGYTVNPVNHCDWGDMITVISNNNVLYFCNNVSSSITGNNLGTYCISGNTIGWYKIADNSNRGDIKNNSNGGDISRNSNRGGIYNNSNTGQILNNSNAGDISDNTSQVLDITGNFNAGYISSNSNTGYISNNGNLGEISTNSNTGSIFNNSNTSSITFNTNGGLIYNNSNGGDISNNSNGGDISGNFNAGSISTNSNTGSIFNNSNNGKIEILTSVVLNVYNNINNGDISTSTAGDIFDTVVNK